MPTFEIFITKTTEAILTYCVKATDADAAEAKAQQLLEDHNYDLEAVATQVGESIDDVDEDFYIQVNEAD